MAPTLRPVARAYLVAIAVTAGLVTAALLARFAAPSLGDAVLTGVLIGLLAVAYRHPLPFANHTRLLLDTAVVLTAVLLLDPGLAALAAGLGPLVSNLPRREEWTQATFNAAQTALQAGAAGIVLAASPWWDPSAPFDGPGAAVAIVVAACAMHVVNTAVVAAMVALQAGRPLLKVWRSVALPVDRTEGLAHLSQLGLGVLAAVVVDAHPWALALLLLPAAAVHVALNHHARLRLRAEESLVHQAFHDALTDLPNRALFLDRLDQALARSERQADTLAVLVLDLDRFKLVNDTLGHAVGDRLLVVVADRLRACARTGDTVARLGGDEFTVLLDGVADVGEAIAVAERILDALAVPIDVAERELVTAASIGIAMPSPGRSTSADLLRAADVALYRAKDAGRNRHAVYEQSMGEATAERLALEGELRRGLARGEFELRYQPQVELATGRIVAVEALVRWAHPSRGLLTPDAFLAVAEETGLIIPIGRWVLEEACGQASAWQTLLADPPVVGVNLSAREFADPGLRHDVELILAKTELAPRLLQLEVGEGAAMADPAATTGTVWGLQRLGVRIVVDDFGTGYGSLGHLGRLPVETLKLDGSFVAGLGRDPEAATIANAVIGLAHHLGLRLVAEGVERADQLAHLRAMGCELGQGSYFAAPLPAPALAALLTRDVASDALLAPAAGGALDPV